MAGAAADTTSSAALSSSSALLLPWKYDVFISFRGADIRSHFLSHLRFAFSRAEIKVFTDENTRKGEQVWEELAKAIEESRVAVVIFSKRFASSTWCLRELKKMLECMEENKQIVIPVFYNIDSSHVRKQTGTYKNALDQYNNRRDISAYELQQWKDCLTEAANLVGWDFKNESNESELVQKIVQDVLQKLRRNTGSRPSEFEGLVGIEESYGRIKSLLENSSIEVRKMGIWGMPGIGKTTLASVAFFQISSQFGGSCFLPNVREQSERHGIDCLREKLFRKLLEDVDLAIGSAGTCFVMSDFDRKRLSRKKVLIVLDDVNSSEQIHDLIGPFVVLGEGSRVIITSRDKNELSGWVDDDDIIEVTTLNSEQSLELFCLKAFKIIYPKMDYETVVKSVVSYANGNPLALTVLGSMLYKKSPTECNTLLTKLKKAPPQRIQHVLELSYDGLEEYQKNIFLDIACFWKGEDIKDLIKILNALYDIESAESEIKALQDKALVTISYKNNEVQMHDLIQQMGREIVRQENTENPGCRSRLWDANNVYDVLKYNKGTDAVKSIFFDVSQCKHVDLSPDVFKRMPNVKYLKFYTSYWGDSCNVNLPAHLDSLPNLRFLHWIGYPSKSLPSTFNAENLVELYMPKSHMKKLWGGIQNLVSLKSINLSSCQNLVKLPNLSQASKLETLDLSNCSNLVEISSWLKYLKELRYLNLELCSKLKRFPRNIHLLHLEKVNCKGCSSLKQFSLTSGKMIYLSLEGTAIERLPTHIWSLNKVKTLILSSSTRFENLPNMPSFQELHNFDDLWKWSLERPNRDVPWDLSSLQDLYLNETNVESLPVSIKYLLRLEKLILKRCNRLRSVPELPPFLSYFCATDCALLETVARSSTDFVSGRRALYYFNCTNLDQTSRNNIITNAQDWIKMGPIEPWQDYHQPFFLDDYHQPYFWVSVCFPGKDIPDWFNIQKPDSSLVFDIGSNEPAFVFSRFALCLVLGEFQEQSEDSEEINVQCRLKLKNSGIQVSCSKFEEHYFKFSQDLPRALSSDHVFIWHDLSFPHGYHPADGALSFEFYGPHGKSDLVRKCGIRPLH